MNEARLGEGEDGDLKLSELAGGLLDPPLSNDVREDVDELLGSIRSFQFQAMYEMGSVRMVDRALSEGFSAEFLRLRWGLDVGLSPLIPLQKNGHPGQLREEKK